MERNGAVVSSAWRNRKSDRGLGLSLGLLLGGPAKNWRQTHTEPSRIVDVAVYADQARKAEAAKIHTIFLADGLGSSRADANPQLEPITLLSALATLTERIGLISSISTTFTEPFNLARQVASLDHISRGRAGWNLVTSSMGAENFGKELPAHDDRYALGTEFVEVVKALWDSWDADAIVADRERNLLVDPDKVHQIDWKSEHFSVRGPLNVPRSPQGRPIIAQAGSSEAGRTLGAAHADLIFTTGLIDLEPSQEIYADFKRRAMAEGRAPDDLKVLPGVAPVIASTDAEAQRYWRESYEHIDFEKSRRGLASQFAGVDFEGIDLDAQIPLHLLPEEETVQGRRSRYGVLRRLILEGQLRTVRDLVIYHSSAAGHWFPIGSVEHIADLLQERYETGAADGFCILAFVFNYPGGLEAVTDHLIPELQRRGIFHADYEHETLRENLGLAPLI